MKLEAGVAALIKNDKKLNETAKMIYYTNSINFGRDEKMRNKCRVTNEFYEFTQADMAEEIEINIDENDQVSLNMTE